MEILSPVWPDRRPPRPPKTRPRSLEGPRIALVDDNLDAVFTTHLEALLGARVGAKVRRWVKPSGTAPSPPPLLAARTQARLQQMPDLEIVVVRHRQGGETSDDQRRRAEALLPALVAKLVEPI